MNKIFELIKKEREKQDEKWGDNRKQPNPIWLAILMEEVGEASESILDMNFIGSNKNISLTKELVQIASVAVAWLETLGEEYE